MDRGAWWATVHVAWTVKNLPAMQETGFDPWVRKIPCRREWQTTPVSLPEKFHGQRSLVGYSPWDRKESDTTEQLTHILTNTQTHILTGSFSPNDLNYCSDLMDVSLFKVSGCLCNSAW